MLLELVRVDRSGASTSLGPPRADVVSQATRELDPAIHEMLVLRGAVEAHVWPLSRAGDWVGSCAMRVHLTEPRWLACAEDGGELEVDGMRIPGIARVSIAWASSALSSFGASCRWPLALPWHDASFRSVEPWRADVFSFAALQRDPARGLPALCDSMWERMRSEPATGFYAAVGELRRVGHDLWSHDVLSDGARWGGDYMRSRLGRGLAIEAGFDPPSLTISFAGVEATRDEGSA